MAFYGLPPAALDKVVRLTIEIMDIYSAHDQPVISGDNMLLAMRSMSFMDDADFNDAVQKYCTDDEGQIVYLNISKFWRLHIYAWCCHQALPLDGDLVECGVHMGLYSLVMMKYLDFASRDRQMYLYDTFEGLSDAHSTPGERSKVKDVYDIEDWEQQVRARFSPYPNAHVIRGVVPEILPDTAPQAVSFLHLDMNAAEPEVAAFEFFEPRLVPGALILLDDFGRSEYKELNAAHRQLFARRGRKILELPTGQGLIIWN